MSFLQKREYILLIKIMDSRFHGNDRMVDSRLHGNGKIESTLVIDKIKIMDSRFHGNDRMVGITNGKTRFPFSRE